jgi:hypothetical protein
MPRVVPSQVVDLIDKLFPWAKDQKEGDAKHSLSAGNSCSIAAILELVQQLPSELITLGAEDFTEFVSGGATLRTLLQQWQNADFSYHRIPGLKYLSPVTLIRHALAKCPDEFPSASTSKLTFIADANLRDNLRLDISATNSALRNGEWKAATVLSGSVIEALLLWALEQRAPGDVQLATKKLVGGTFNRPPPASLDNWVLFQYIEVAVERRLITADTAVAARLAKDFRNLIHPGRAKRLGQECNRGTALSAVAALEHVVNDLTP